MAPYSLTIIQSKIFHVYEVQKCLMAYCTLRDKTDPYGAVYLFTNSSMLKINTVNFIVAGFSCLHDT